MTLRKIFPVFALLVLALGVTAQNRTKFAGERNATGYAYGIAPGVASLQISTGTAAGAGTITLSNGFATNSTGEVFYPLTTNAPIAVGYGATRDVVTPSAVSGCTTLAAYTCTVTATFTYAHGVGEPVMSGTVGLQEAINLQQAAGGGGVDVDTTWSQLGGTSAMLTAAAPYSAVWINDNRGSATQAYWSVQPSTLSLLAVPAVLSAATIASGTTLGTWTAADTYFCMTYVDALGGESGCSATYDVTLTTVVAVNVTAAASPASTGAVGWRLYAGATYAAAYLLPISGGGAGQVTTSGTAVTWVSGNYFMGPNNSASAYIGQTMTINGVAYLVSTVNSPTSITLTATAGTQATPVGYTLAANCTTTTLESVYPACAIGSAAVFPTANTTTTQLKPAPATPLQNVNNPVPQGHTTFAYQPSQTPPVPFQTHYAPFPAVGTITAGNFAILGTFQLPAGYLNSIGRSVRISGKITATVTTADTFAIIVGTVWPGGVTAGLPTAICSAAETDAYTGTAMYLNFSCTLDTNAVGNTAIGSIWPSTTAVMGSTAGTIAGIVIPDKTTAVAGSLGLMAQQAFYVKLGSIAQTASAAQLMDLHIETLQ